MIANRLIVNGGKVGNWFWRSKGVGVVLFWRRTLACNVPMAVAIVTAYGSVGARIVGSGGVRSCFCHVLY